MIMFRAASMMRGALTLVFSDAYTSHSLPWKCVFRVTVPPEMTRPWFVMAVDMLYLDISFPGAYSTIMQEVTAVGGLINASVWL